MTTFTEKLIYGRMERSTKELDTNVSLSGKVFESITLGLGDTTLEREVLPNGTRGEVNICTQENDGLFGNSVTYRRYAISEGNLVPEARYSERTIGKLRKASLLAKIAFGRINHWDKESDFNGTFVEYDEE